MRFGVRVLFGLVLVLFVVQFVVTRVWDEPYPGLSQPGFGGAHGDGKTTTVQQPTVTAAYTDGSTTTFSHRDVMARSKSLQLTIFRNAFGPNSPRRSKPQTVAWLNRRLSDLGGGREPVRAVVAWREVTYDVTTERIVRVTTTDRDVISFGGERG